MSTLFQVRSRIKSLFKMDHQDNTFSFAAPLDVQQLAGKRVLITGGASGIGAGCARFFVSHESHVIIADLNEELGKALIGELEGLRGTYARMSFLLLWTLCHNIRPNTQLQSPLHTRRRLIHQQPKSHVRNSPLSPPWPRNRRPHPLRHNLQQLGLHARPSRRTHE